MISLKILLGLVLLFSGTSSKSLDFEEALKSLTEEVHSLKAEVNTLKTENVRLKAVNDPGFTAYPSIDQGFDVNDKVIFDLTSVNEGGHYSTANSQFMCPVDGMYFFSLALESLTTADPNFWASVVRDVAASGTEEVVVSTDCYDPYDHHCSNSALAMCQQGDIVWVRTGAGGEMSGAFDNLKCSIFMGFLVSIA